jgi:putative phosphoribosyl transferase
MNGVSEIDIAIGGQVHKAILGVPNGATSIVIFAHGSGSSRLSRRNNFVAEVIRGRAIATLLFDLLTEDEDRVYANRFDIPLLTERLIEVTHWIQKQPEFTGFRLGYFGASTGAAAALQAAAQLGKSISAVVSRGGRPDLAGTADLNLVLSPTLLIVGGDDNAVIELNQQAYSYLTSVKNLKIVPGATHLFEEPGTLEQAANLAADWFEKYLVEKTIDKIHA